jgi:hypothetical protein
MNIAMSGIGYIGLVVGARPAEPGDDVTCADLDKDRLEGVKRGVCPATSQDFEGVRALRRAPGGSDSRNLYHPRQLRDLRLEYYSIGRPAVTERDSERLRAPEHWGDI